MSYNYFTFISKVIMDNNQNCDVNTWSELCLKMRKDEIRSSPNLFSNMWQNECHPIQILSKNNDKK